MSRIAAIQLNSGDDIDKNLDLTAKLVTQSTSAGALLAVLPECFALMTTDDRQRFESAESEYHSGRIRQFLTQLASDQRIWILAAGVFIRSGSSQKVRNATYLINDEGACVIRYDKIHLFNVQLPSGESYSESRYTERGTEVRAADTPVGRCGVTVCYDVRFPSLYQQLAERGAVWFAVPSAFAYTTGKAHWEILLRARAIENHSYVVAPAQWGSHPGGRRTYGHSMIVDPWGQLVSCQAHGNEVLLGDIDCEYVESTRSRFSTSSRTFD